MRNPWRPFQGSWLGAAETERLLQICIEKPKPQIQFAVWKGRNEHRGKEAPRGKTVFPLPKPAHKKFYFRQDRAACCRGENCYILTEYPLDRSQPDWTTFGEP